jgi:hypothetical protein
MFQLTARELAAKMGLRRSPLVFTEQGVAMLSSVLQSDRAVQVNIAIVRTFVRLRQILATHKELAERLAAMEKKYDERFKVVFDIRRCSNARRNATPSQIKSARLRLTTLRGTSETAAFHLAACGSKVKSENVPFGQSRNVPPDFREFAPIPSGAIVLLAAEPVKASLRRAQNRRAALTEPAASRKPTSPIRGNGRFWNAVPGDVSTLLGRGTFLLCRDISLGRLDSATSLG